MTELQGIADLETCVLRSGLLSLLQLAEPMAEANAAGENAHAFALRLVKARLLTPFQAQNLSEGRHKGFFIAGKYKALGYLGAGGVGQILLCEHLLLHRLVAVKMLKPEVRDLRSETVIQRFLREARAVAALDHPNIVRVFDMDFADGIHYLGMEHVDGENLHRLVALHGRMAPARAAQCVAQAARGLEHARRAGLIHRDVKPGNILLDRSGIAKVADLGLARFELESARNQGLTQHFDRNSVVGTAEYIAPEQALDHAQADIRSDLYALGGTLHFLISGQAPFGEANVAQQLLVRQLRDPPLLHELRPEVSEGLSQVVRKMMARNPDERYQTPAEVVAALASFVPPHLIVPAAKEMPRVPAGAYLLGLAPPGGHPRPKEAAPAGAAGEMTFGGAAQDVSMTATPGPGDPGQATPQARTPRGAATPVMGANSAAAALAPRALAAFGAAVFVLAALGAALGTWLMWQWLPKGPL